MNADRDTLSVQVAADEPMAHNHPASPARVDHLSADQVLSRFGLAGLSRAEQWQLVVNAFPAGGLRFGRAA